ncbi:hypothetical protein DXT95_18050 [Agrobacterium tumefaciens]|nr:hypothetical protein [Agrobacterium tumefaciens]
MLHPHSRACHGNPADARRRGGRTPVSPRTWADWIPVTSTGMRESYGTRIGLRAQPYCDLNASFQRSIRRLRFT